MISEFDLIERFFTRPSDIPVGIGDDAAVLDLPHNEQLLATVDTLVVGTHFILSDDPVAVGHKLLSVSLSDLAAMGGTPRWATLALTIPQIDESWLQGFSEGLFALADTHQVRLVGGDTTRGNVLTLSLHLLGTVPAGQAVTRSGAKAGEIIAVTGKLGGAAFQLGEKLAGNATPAMQLDFPVPQVQAGLQLRGLASAMIDISDGLLQDLSHILKASGVGAEVDVTTVPAAAECASLEPQICYPYILSGGEDYELCFTVAPDVWPLVQEEMRKIDVTVSQIGTTRVEPGLELTGLPDDVRLARSGYAHF